ncbi:MAG: hypothetical protein KatS3mg008_1013 [Acidimicrobiales bacterium]|nr:MAG: hypothetical protein KatS3mg008_1013 [Acidimicrobiales bacterium]
MQNYQDLVRNEGVFALFNGVGTAHNLAIRERQNRDCVPNLFVATGSQLWGNPEEYPWTIGSIPTYPTEMAVLVEYLKETSPDATIAVLYQNDDFGKGYLTALEELVEGTEMRIVSRQSYDPENTDVSGQVTSLKDSNADVFVIGATALACPNALGAKQRLRWEPGVTYISATCTSGTVMALTPAGAADGVWSAGYLMDPRDPQWEDNEQMKEFKELGAKYGLSSEDLENGLVGYGWTMAQLLEITLRKAPELTRADVMNTAWSLSGERPGLLMPEVEVNTDGSDDPYPIEAMRLIRFDGNLWQLQEKVYDFEGKTKEFSRLES